MAKSTAHIDKLGGYDQFRAPWESEAGGDADVDKPTLKRLVYNFKKDLATVRDTLDDTKATLTETEAQRDEAKSQAADGSGAEAQKQIDKLTKERDDLKAERDGLVKDKEVADLRAEVLGDFATKYPKAAKYVEGETQEELEESLKGVAEDFGIDLEGGDGDDNENDEDDEDEDTDLDKAARTRPVGRSLLNPADKANGKGGDDAIDFDKVAGDILSGGRTFG